MISAYLPEVSLLVMSCTAATVSSIRPTPCVLPRLRSPAHGTIRMKMHMSAASLSRGAWHLGHVQGAGAALNLRRLHRPDLVGRAIRVHDAGDVVELVPSVAQEHEGVKRWTEGSSRCEPEQFCCGGCAATRRTRLRTQRQAVLFGAAALRHLVKSTGCMGWSGWGSCPGAALSSRCGRPEK